MLWSVLIWICIVFSYSPVVVVIRSISVGGSQSRPPRHSLGRKDHDPAAHLPYQLAQIVEQVIYPRIAQIGNVDPTCRAVEPTANHAVGLDQQRRNASGGGRLRHLCRVVTTKPIGLRYGELVSQCNQPRLKLRRDDLPGAF